MIRYWGILPPFPTKHHKGQFSGHAVEARKTHVVEHSDVACWDSVEQGHLAFQTMK